MEKQEIHSKRLDPFPTRSLKKENLSNQVFEQVKEIIVRTSATRSLNRLKKSL